MFDAPLVQVALGLMLIFVLFSLLVSAVQEMGAALFKSRSAALWDSVETLLGGGENARAARNRIYAHPLIRTLVPPNSISWSKPKPGRRTGPSYIAAPTFAKALVDVLRAPHDELEGELRRALADLRRGDATAAARTKEALATLAAKFSAQPQADATGVSGTIRRGWRRIMRSPAPPSPSTVGLQVRLQSLQDALAAGTLPQHITAVETALAALPADWKAALHEGARSISGELEGALTALASDTAGGIDDLRKAIEEWFDQSMASVSGWYKRWTMAVQLGIGIVLAAALNIDTVHIARELSVNEPLRRSLATHAEAYARTGVLEQRVITADTSQSPVNVSVRSTGVDAFTLGLPAEAAGKPVAITATAGPGDVLSCDPQATPEGAVQGASAAEAQVTCRVAARQITTRTKLTLEASWTGASPDTPTKATLDVFLLPTPEVQYEQIEKALQATAVPIGWKDGRPYPEQSAGRVAYVLMFAGWLFTALAGSLGAPFWFDLLKRVASLRASGPSPAEREAEKAALNGRTTART